MATVYSLFCWGGSSGKTPTINTTTDQLTLTNHGLRNGKALQYVGGTLPSVSGTALAFSTDYYAKWISTSLFELYYDSGLTSKINFTSSGSGWVLKSSWYMGLPDTSRWGTRIYDGRVSWNTARAAASTIFDTEVAEFGDDFDDISGSSFSLTMNSAAVVMTSLVNGVRGNGWHGGFKGAGYVAMVPNGGLTALGSGNIQDVTFDGFSCTVLSTSTSGTALTTSSRGGNVVKNMILSGISTSFGVGISLQGAMTKLQRCLITKLLRGVATSSFTYGALIANNTVVGNGTGIYAEGSGASTYGKWYNNAVYGNTTNWSRAAPAAVEAASNNTGEAADAIATWEVGPGATSLDITSAAFANYAGRDFRPASASSLLFDAGTDYYGRLEFDIADAEVPNYNNGGAEGIDIGCFEFNSGYGNHPASATVTFSGVVAGSEIRVYNAALDELAGVESCSTDHALTWIVPSPPTVTIKIINPAYKIKDFPYTSTAGAQSIPIQMELDRWFSNPGSAE